MADSDLDRRLALLTGTYRERLPMAPLRDAVDCIWTNEITRPIQLDIVPDGCIDIYWTGEALRVAGPNANLVTAAITRPGTLVGVRFKPGVAASWLHTSAEELLNAHPSLDEFWGRRATQRLADDLAEAPTRAAAVAILERVLLDRSQHIRPPHAIVRATVAAAKQREHGSRSMVQSILDDMGCSERTLRRRCHEAFGYGPKTLQRILRFQRFLRLLERAQPAPLSLLSIEAGYADQAHLAREVRRFCRMSPRGLMAELCA
jgi:AraC-like DNA-binding protein